MAVENELTAWQQQGQFTSSPEAALRLKASLERIQRMTHSYTESLLEVFPDRVNKLGKALGIEEERLKVFTEAEVRASLVFQLSKLCSMLLKATRLATGAGAWDALVAGTAVGKLVEVDSIQPGAIQGQDINEDVVLLVKAASGDEEVGATGLQLKGVILQHSLPHLSHLGVRARQEKVVFVTCEDEDTIDADVRKHIGQRVQLTASLEGVKFAPATDAAGAPKAASSNGAKPSSSNGASAPSAARPAAIEKAKKAKLVPLTEATTATCGAKAAACAELARVAEQNTGLFSAPSGACLVFGNMEAALQESGKSKEYQALLQQAETAPVEGGQLDGVCEQLQALVGGLKPANAILKEAGKALGDAIVIVRSSANVEDLAGMSGAGLYDSIPNVPAAHADALGAAVGEVWASLYSRRAILSRRAAGVPQAEACMAVLLQQQVAPQFSFVLHTASALGGDSGSLTAELASGLGETLASGTRGSPWRLEVDKQSGKARTLAFANFSTALQSGASSKALAAAGPSSGSSTSGQVIQSQSRNPVVDYSKEKLSTDEDFRQQLATKLCKVGCLLEESFHGPQDVEGAVDGDTVYIVQTRPQPI
jgi:phosphoglucan,water dikinase